jgi:hypothetical protein
MLYSLASGFIDGISFPHSTLSKLSQSSHKINNCLSSFTPPRAKGLSRLEATT